MSCNDARILIANHFARANVQYQRVGRRRAIYIAQENRVEGHDSGHTTRVAVEEWLTRIKQRRLVYGQSVGASVGSQQLPRRFATSPTARITGQPVVNAIAFKHIIVERERTGERKNKLRGGAGLLQEEVGIAWMQFVHPKFHHRLSRFGRRFVVGQIECRARFKGQSRPFGDALQARIRVGQQFDGLIEVFVGMLQHHFLAVARFI